MPKSKQTPLDRIAMARSWLDLTERHPSLLTAPDAAEQIAQVRLAFRELMAFRNIIAVMAPFSENPADAARDFLEQ